LSEGECNSPLQIFAKMNGIGIKQLPGLVSHRLFLPATPFEENPPLSRPGVAR
jgi:hypothetical protein